MLASELELANMPPIHELQKQRADFIKQAAAIRDGAKASERELTDDESAKIDAILVKAEDAQKQIEEAKAAADKAKRLANLDTLVDSLGSGKSETGGNGKATDLTTARKVYATARRFRSQIWQGPDAEKHAHAFGSWIKYAYRRDSANVTWLADNGYLGMDAAQYTTANTAGGFMVPPPALFNSVIDLVEQYGVFRANAFNVSMSGNELLVPKVTSGVTAYWMGEANSDSATGITASSLAGNNVNVTASKLATLTYVSRELMADSAVNVGELIGRKIALAFALAEDQAGFIGDGSATYGGYVGVTSFVGAGSLYTSATAGQTSFGAITLAECSNAMAKLPQYARANAKWYISAAGYSALMARLQYSAGGNAVNDIAGGAALSFMGHPVVISQVLNSTLTAQTSTKIFAFGDLTLGAYFGDRQMPEIAVSDDYKFNTDQVSIRAVERVGIANHSYDHASTAGPVIVFKTASS